FSLHQISGVSIMSITKPNPQPFYIKLAAVLVGLICLGYLSVAGKEILSPLIFGLLFSILLLPVAEFLEKKLKFRRNAASAVAVLVMLVTVGGILLVVGTQISRLSNDLPQLKEQVYESLQSFQQWISATFHVNIEKQMDYVNSATSKIENATPKVIGATVVSLSSILFFLIFVVLDTFFMLFYRRRLMKFLIDVFKEENAQVVHDIVERIQFIIRKYLTGLLLEMTTVAVVCCSVFMILGIKYAILLGLITALFNIVPYIGIFTALALNVIITFATTGLASKVLLVVITVVSVHIVDSNVLLPLIVGSKVRINAFVTLLGVVIGEMLWGISGMFLSIPVIAITKIIFDRVESLQPWGHLMGDEKIPQKHFIKKKYHNE
ncbi:MAG TPA: AI-2E family transporter, partial [Chitinophagaceae bacterium]|nr:AI-2E family transporter [Chitinophagaceae bacterium]